MKFRAAALAVFFATIPAFALADDAVATKPYTLLKSEKVGGEGRWDYVTVDSANRRLYIPRSSRVDVYDVDSLAKVGEIPATPGVHGVAIDLESGHGFTSNGGGPSVTMFDLKTLKVIQKIDVAGKPDGIFIEPATKHVFVESHSDPNITVLNAADGAVIGTIDLGGEPEQGASDGKGHVYINLESTSEVVAVDPNTNKVTTRYAMGDGDSPSGMGYDAKNNIIFSCCGNEKMVILDGATGKILATLPIGKRVDGGAFNPDTLEAFSSNGDGTLTVVKETSPTTFEVETNVKTKPGARTCAVDTKTGNIYLVSAEMGAVPTQPAPGEKRARPPMIKGSFSIDVVGK